jgi:hypothetical protein
LRKGRRYPREQLEDHKFGVAELVFDIVPKDPQKQHVAAEVAAPFGDTMVQAALHCALSKDFRFSAALRTICRAK